MKNTTCHGVKKIHVSFVNNFKLKKGEERKPNHVWCEEKEKSEIVQ
jgi:hypothetical protein